MEMEILGMNFSCVLRSLSSWKIPESDCLLPLISKLLGYCIVAASTTVKVPQILKILKHSSVRGLSIAAFELEVVGYTIALSYCLHKGLPFSAYGELAFLLIQALILVAIIYYYSWPVGLKTLGLALLYCAVAPTILAGQIDPVLFEALYASQHAIFFFARVPQIWKNYTFSFGQSLEFARMKHFNFRSTHQAHCSSCELILEFQLARMHMYVCICQDLFGEEGSFLCRKPMKKQ